MLRTGDMVRRTESMPAFLDGTHSDDGESEADAAGPPAPPPAPPQSEWRAVNRMAQHVPGLKVTGGGVLQMRRGSRFTRAESSPLNSQVRMSLLDNLTPKQSEACVAVMSVVEFNAGDDIVMQGSFGTTMVSARAMFAMHACAPSAYTLCMSAMCTLGNAWACTVFP